MNEEVFFQQLAAELAALSDTERARAIDFYREMLCDGMENGADAASLIAGFGSPKEIAAQILAESRSVVPDTVQSAASENRPPVEQPPLDGYAARGQVTSIVISARHTPIEVRPVASGPVQVHYEPTAQDFVSCTEEDGRFTFSHTMRFPLFHWSALFAGIRKIIVDVPASFTGTIAVSTCNASLSAADLHKLTAAQFVTTNAHLTLRRISCTALTATTSNGTVELQELRGRSCTVETSNARISTVDCIFPDVMSLFSSNGAIRAWKTVSDHPEFSTSNGTVQSTIIGDMREYAIRSHTSNASNNLPPELCYPEQTKTLNVKTNNAKIDVHFIAQPEL
jgi:hypothetical protein